jgi:uncharacterized repeat protein (TIGR03837 family)
LEQQQTMKSWDIFCRVIDNYGDIGVCWRLARQLAAEYPFKVRLWVDELAALKMIWPSTELIPQQTLEGVDVCHWTPEFPDHISPADTVIEAFACDIPAIYLQKMIQAKSSGQPPVWINLEYLSAEKWVEDCHKMQSIHPQSGLKKTFFFPGFTEKTGGLICEKEIRGKNLPPIPQVNNPPYDSPLLISLFAYENGAIESLIEVWAKGNRPIHCLIPQGRILNSINPLLDKPLAIGEPQIKSSLTLEAIPFMNQLEYDQLLQKCDLNFVRGEDSLVRAIWAGKPFVWHIYQQEEDAHLIKLEAFLDLYKKELPMDLAKSIHGFWLDWNRQESVIESWEKLDLLWDQWVRENWDWGESIMKQRDLVEHLVGFVSPQPGSHFEKGD